MHGPRFRLLATQSALGQAFLLHYGLNPDDPSTMLVIEDSRVLERSDAVLHVARGLPFPYRLAVLVYLVLRPLRDWAYGMVACNCRRFAGPTWCSLPPQGVDMKDRILS